LLTAIRLVKQGCDAEGTGMVLRQHLLEK
jgi:hypothetical protein